MQQQQQKSKSTFSLQSVDTELTAEKELNHYVATITYGDKVHKKTKSNKLPTWSELHQEFSINLEKDIPDLHIRITGKVKKGLSKKITIGVATIYFDSNISKSPQTYDLTADLIDGSSSVTGKMRIKLLMNGGPTPVPVRSGSKYPAGRYKQPNRNDRTGKRNSKIMSANAPPIFTIIKECGRDKNISALEDFLKTAGPEDVNVKLPRSGNSPLHEACIEREEQLLNALLKFPGIDVNVKNEDENTPLHYFCEKWTSPDYLTSFNLFIKQGAKVDATNSNRETPIFKAIFNPSIRALLMEALIGKGADLTVVTNSSESLLHYAVRLNRADLVRLILQNRPRLDGNKEGETPDGLANQLNGSVNIKKYLQSVSELFKWLEENDLEDLKGIFVKNEITVPLLTDITDPVLQQMGVDKIGVRMKILKACENEKEASKTREQITGLTKKEEISGQVLDDLEYEIRGVTTQGEGILDGNLLEYTKHLGTGAAGDVYKGLYQGSVVAIKILSVKSQEKEVEEFKKEFEILRAVRNPFVVKFVGVAMKPYLCMVMEYCSRGSLHSAMKDPAAEINWARAIGFCKEACLGLHGLHQNTPQILHRDLKTLNLLVNQEWHIKLADFGLSRFATAENLQTMKQMRGTFQYLDPEIYNGGTFTAASDIYSMSIIFWEIVYRVMTGIYQQPFTEYKNLTLDFQIIVQSAKEDLRPTIPAGCPASMRDVITSCWHKHQSARPKLPDLMKMLENIETEYKSKPQEWDSVRKIN